MEKKGEVVKVEQKECNVKIEMQDIDQSDLELKIEIQQKERKGELAVKSSCERFQPQKVSGANPNSIFTIGTATAESEPICQKCHEIYDDPRLLSCLHSFCRHCLHDMTVTLDTSNVISCTICEGITAVPTEGLDGIPANLYLEHEATIARFESRMNEETLPICEECKRDPPHETTSFCCTCVSFLCEKCNQQHKLSKKSHLHHKLLSLNDDKSNLKAKLRQNLTFLPTTCSVHVRQEIAFFCNQCKILICIQCALSKHPGHRVEDLPDFVKRQKNNFCEEVKELPEVLGKLDDLMNSGRIVCGNIKTRERSIEDNINKVFSELHQCLDARKNALHDQCAKIAVGKLKSLNKQIEELVSLKDAIITCNDFVITSRDAFDESEFISVLSTLNNRIDHIKRRTKQTPLDLSEDDSIQFNSDCSTVINSISVMGSVFVMKNQDYSTLHDPISTIKTTNAYHVAVHRSGDYIVANHIGDSIEVYDSTGIKKRTFGSQGCRPGQFRRPLGVTIIGDILYIVEFNGSRCQKMTVNGDFLCEIGSGKLSGAWGCAVSKNGVVYIAEESSNRVQAFTPDGKTLKILCASPTVYSPRDVAIDMQGKIHVAACGSKCIKVFDCHGTFLRDYGSGIVQEPSGVSVDQMGMCFVADWSGKSLHVFNQSGQHMHKVEFEGCISGTTIDDNNHLHVVNNTGQTISKY